MLLDKGSWLVKIEDGFCSLSGTYPKQAVITAERINASGFAKANPTAALNLFKNL
jgi:hypothetical protein